MEDVVEKPTPTEAEQQLIVPGLRAGHYLCFFGMHVLTPSVMDMLGEVRAAAKEGARVHLSAALARLANNERYLACELNGRRLRHRREVRLADRAAGAGARRARIAMKCSRGLVELLAVKGPAL